MFLPLHDQNPIRHVDFPYVTYGLLAANLVIFLFQLATPGYGFEWFTVEYGMIPVVVRDIVDQPVAWLPDWANLVTYAFLHADWMHLIGNMLFLWIFGDNIEDAFGHVKYLIFYLLCAALSGLAHIATHFDDYGQLIGASGAVAGVMGAYVLLYPHARVFVLFRIVIPIPLPIPALWMLGVWIATQLFYAFAGSDEPIAWWAHVGGVAAGALLAMPFKRREVPLFGGR